MTSCVCLSTSLSLRLSFSVSLPLSQSLPISPSVFGIEQNEEKHAASGWQSCSYLARHIYEYVYVYTCVCLVTCGPVSSRQSRRLPVLVHRRFRCQALSHYRVSRIAVYKRPRNILGSPLPSFLLPLCFSLVSDRPCRPYLY